jgi:DNA (cytosine-5)-methyltransferase 1
MPLYNEIDPNLCAWLRNLMAAREIPDGEICGQDIREIKSVEHESAHFFAGIGGWPLALRLAGWPDDRPVWTGSCPCQPFSVAGKGLGKNDDRHLWPAWFKLIKKHRPPTIFGEQVDGAIRLGWLDLVFDDLERIGYACWAAVLPAACVGAPHLRHRIFWMGFADQPGRQPRRESAEADGHGNPAVAASGPGGMGDMHGVGRVGRPDDEDGGRREHASGHPGQARGLGDSERERQRTGVEGIERSPRIGGGGSPDAGPWEHVEWIPCADGKARPVKPRTKLLDHGVSGNVAIRRAEKEQWYSRRTALKGLGNAIVPQVAAEFVKVCMEEF